MAANGLLARVSTATKILTGSLTQAQVLNLLFPGMRGNPPPRGTIEFLRAYTEMPWLRATLHRVAGSVAQATWHAYAVREAPARPGIPTGGNGNGNGNGSGTSLSPRGKYVHDPILARCASWSSRMQRFKQLSQAGRLDELETHPVLDLLHKPNSMFTGLAHRKLTSIYFDLIGEGYWMYERGPFGTPVGVWNIPPNWVRNIPTPSQPYFIIQGYGNVAEVPPSEVLVFKDPDPVNPFGRGAGTAKALSDELETDEYAAKHTRQFFFSGARPDYLVIADGASQPELRRLQQKWQERSQGFWRAWQAMFLNQEVKIEKLEAQTFREMQFIELRKMERDTIVQVFGLPPELLGIIENANRATIDAADYLMGRHVLQPRLEFLRETMQEFMVPLFDDRILLEYDTPVTEDRAFQLEALKANPWTAKVDEWRTVQGLEPLGKENGGELFTGPNTTSAAEEPGGGAAPPVSLLPILPGGPKPPALPKPTDGTDGDGTPPADGEDVVEPGKGRRRLRAGSGSRPFFAMHKITDEAFAELVQRIADAMEPKWRKVFVQAVKDAQKTVSLDELARALGSRDRDRIVATLHLDQLSAALRDKDAVPDVIAQTVRAAGDASADALSNELGIGVTFDFKNPAVVQFLQDNAQELLQNFDQTTGVAVREIIEWSFREGISVDDTAKVLRGVIGLDSRRAQAVASFQSDLVAEGAENYEQRVARYAAAQVADRALVIARTEAIRGSNGGQHLLWDQAVDEGALDPARIRRVWIVTDDDRLDAEICEPMDGQLVAMDEPFITGDGAALFYPPAHPNCRCAVGLRILRQE